MSQIKLLYERFLETEASANARKDHAMEICVEILPHREYAEVEELLSKAEDEMSEEAFRAGFRSAVRLMREAIG